ncbi:MAG: hypothetical protein ACRD12_09810 [Acidimicrobiales bacterium]
MRGHAALAVALVAVFSVAVVSLGVKSGHEFWPRPHADVSERESGAPPVAASLGRPQGAPRLAVWEANAARVMDDFTLAAAGIRVPVGANVFAARIYAGGQSPAYRFYEAGGGAFDETFYPASAVKLLAALGALDFAASLGFTGDVVIDGGSTLREIVDGAIRWSSNDDYDLLVQIAGADRLNLEFLPANGYDTTVIQESYTNADVLLWSPSMVLSEDGREVEVPERNGRGFYGCGVTNCSTLFDLTDAIRRVVLDAEIPTAERFALAPADITALQVSLLGADAWITPGVQDALGSDALVFAKPGHVGGLDCVDDALVAAPSSGDRYLIGLSVPDYEGCDLLPALAAEVLTVLDHERDGPALRTDGSLVDVVDGHQVHD